MDAGLPAAHESPAARAWITIVVLVAIVVADLVAIGSDLAEVRLLQRAGTEGISFDEADANDVRQAAIGAVQLVLFIGAAVAFIAWLRRMYENAIALAPPDPRYGAGWTIGAWFVPVWNLFRPVQLVNDVRRSGEPHPNWVPVVIWTGGDSGSRASSSTTSRCRSRATTRRSTRRSPGRSGLRLRTPSTCSRPGSRSPSSTCSRTPRKSGPSAPEPPAGRVPPGRARTGR